MIVIVISGHIAIRIRCNSNRARLGKLLLLKIQFPIRMNDIISQSLGKRMRFSCRLTVAQKTCSLLFCAILAPGRQLRSAFSLASNRVELLLYEHPIEVSEIAVNQTFQPRKLHVQFR